MTGAPDPTFIGALLRTPPTHLTGLGRAFPPERTLKAQRRLRGASRGGDRFARDLCLQVWAAHGLHAPGHTLPGTLGQAVAGGDLSESRALNLLRAPRAGLHLHLAPVAGLLRHAETPWALDYSALYEELLFFAAPQAQRWAAAYHAARRGGPNPWPLNTHAPCP